jgi:NTE family protein
VDRQQNSRHRLGLALSGGTLKATAHIGVLSALHSLGIYPDCVAGTSAGALVAALYAHGYSPEELTRMIRRFPGPSLFDLGCPLTSSLYTTIWYRMNKDHSKAHYRVPSGLLRGNKLYRYIRQRFKGRSAILPYFITATDLVSGQPVTYSNDPEALAKGQAEPIEDLALCIRGSCSLPGALTPVKIGRRILVDGAFRHYVPVKVLRDAGCSKIIAVNLYSLQKDWRPASIVHILARSYDILLQESVESDIEGPATVVLEPDVSHLSWFSFKEMETGVSIGRNTVLDHADKLFALLHDTNDHREANDDAAAVRSRRPAIRITINSQTSDSRT